MSQDDKFSTATSRARWAGKMSALSSASELPDVTEDRPSAATRHVERMRRERGGVPVRFDIGEGVAAERSMQQPPVDQSEKMWRRIRDEGQLRDFVEDEARLRARIIEIIRRREELKAAMLAGTTPPARRPKPKVLEQLANSEEYDVCVECGFFELASPTPSAKCPGCGTAAIPLEGHARRPFEK